VQYKLLC